MKINISLECVMCVCAKCTCLRCSSVPKVKERVFKFSVLIFGHSWKSTTQTDYNQPNPTSFSPKGKIWE